MFPGRAAINADDQIQVAADNRPPAPFNAPQFTPNRDLGDRMRNRDWAGRESQAYYEMGQAPLPHQFTRGAAHPVFGGGQSVEGMSA